MQQISHTSENTLIASLTKDLVSTPEILVGVGDDCAVIKKDETYHTLLKTDTVVEGIHFESKEDPTRVGWKAAARVISDFASMGGKPEALLITIILPPETELNWIHKIYNGLKAVCQDFNCSIVGGETSSAPTGSPKIISVSGTGIVQTSNLTLRNRGSSGDLIYVTGSLGGSIHGKHLDFTPRVKEGMWLAEHIKPTSMLDLSDGIDKDLPRIADQSQTGFKIYSAKLPLNPNCTTKQALSDGEDYELLFTISAARKNELETSWATQFPKLRLTNIGHLTELPPDSPEPDPAKNTGGWDHFPK